MPNFYWNNTFAPTMQVAGDLEVKGDTSLQSLVASSGAYSGNLTVSGSTKLANLDTASISASGTLTVDGVSTLAALSATSIEDSGTLSVNGSSSLESAIMQSASISNNLTVSGSTTVEGLTASSIEDTGTLVVSGSSTLQSVDFQGGTSHNNLVFDATYGTQFTMASGNYGALFADTDNKLYVDMVKGTTHTESLIFDESGSSTTAYFGSPVSGNEVGTSAIARTNQGFNKTIVGNGSNFTPTAGTYICGTSDTTNTVYSSNLTYWSSYLSPITIFDGGAYIHNNSSIDVDVYLAILGN